MFSLVMKYGEIAVDYLLVRRADVPMDLRQRKATLEDFIEKGNHGKDQESREMRIQIVPKSAKLMM